MWADVPNLMIFLRVDQPETVGHQAEIVQQSEREIDAWCHAVALRQPCCGA